MPGAFRVCGYVHGKGELPWGIQEGSNYLDVDKRVFRVENNHSSREFIACPVLCV